MPDQPKIPLPDWVPPEYEKQFRDFGYNSQAELAQIGEAERPVLLNLMAKQKKRENWVSSKQDLDAGKGHVPKEQIDHYFDRDVKEGEKGHGWGPDWKVAILRHPNTDLTPEVLNEIANKKDHTLFVRAAAWMHPKANGPLPDDLRLGDFNGTHGKRIGAVSDERLSELINHDAKKVKETHLALGGYPHLPARTSYDTTAFARYLLEDNNSRYGGPKPITTETHPQTIDALVNHPQSDVRAMVAHNIKLDDKHVNALLAGAQPTLNGHPVTDEHKEHLNRDLNNNPTGDEGTDSIIAGLQNDFYKENVNKEPILRALSYNNNLTTPQVDSLAKIATRVNEIGRATGAYDHKILQKVASHPNVSPDAQFNLLSNPYDFIDKVQQDYEINRDKRTGRYNNGAEPEPGMIHPEVFNKHFPAMMDHFKKMYESSNSWEGNNQINSMMEHPHISPENIKWTYEQSKKDLAEKGKTALAWPTLLNHPQTSEEIKRDMWHQLWNPSPKEQERLFHGATEGGKPIILGDRARRMGISMLEGGKIPNDLATDIIKRTDITTADLPNLGPEQHRIILDKAKAEQYSNGAHNDNQEALESVARHTTDPNLIREAHQRLKEWDWDPNDASRAYHESNLANIRDLQHLYEPFKINPNTPSDVITKIHDDFPDANLMGHPNFPQERIEHFANLPEHDENGNVTANHKWNREHAIDILKDVDPDKYSYKISGPGESHIATGTHAKGSEFGRVQSKPGLAKLRIFRDKILENNPSKGELSPKDLGQGPFGGNWKPVQEKNGNISAKKIQELIDSHPSMDYNFSHEPWAGAQRHSEHDQRVFKLNVTSDHIKKMKQAGVYNAFKKLSTYSQDSGHPSDSGHTLGWVRYEHHQDPATKAKEQHVKDKALVDKLHEGEKDPDEAVTDSIGAMAAAKEHDTVNGKPEHIHVDEIQSDMGPNLIAKLRENPERARSMGVDPDHIEKVHKIVFGDHHPSEVLMEAFRQHHRDQGRHNIPIHVLDAKTKAPISGQDTSDPKKPLPAHMQFTYSQMPKKMGFQPNKYGASAQQDSPQVKPTPGSIWTDKIRKFEEELINKAISDIRVGKETHLYNASQQTKLPRQMGFGRRNIFDYNHLLTPEHKKAGYQLYVDHAPDAKIEARVYHKGDWKGSVEGKINPYSGEQLRIDTAHLSHEHRGKGLGTAMYEAVLGHARNKAGITSVRGTSHSTMAHAVHNKLAAKHGLAYKALPNYMEGSYQHWPDQESWEAQESGPNDDKWGGYEYMIKKESDHQPFRAAGFKNKESGQVIETGSIHDVGILPEEYDPAKWLDGFIDHSGQFHDREQAKKLLTLSIKKHHAEWCEMYKNEDGILAMLEQDDPQERILALKSAGVAGHHILIGINDIDPNVRAFAATHSMINGPLLMECLRQAKDPEIVKLLLGHESCDDSHMNYALETQDWGANGGEIEDDLA